MHNCQECLGELKQTHSCMHIEIIPSIIKNEIQMHKCQHGPKSMQTLLALTLTSIKYIYNKEREHKQSMYSQTRLGT